MNAVMEARRPVYSLPLSDQFKGSIDALVRRALRNMAPPPSIPLTEWATCYRFLAPESSARSGRYDVSITPYMVGIHAALDDPNIKKVVVMKSAQVGYTDGVVNNFIGHKIDLDPQAIIMMFPKEGAAREYVHEKLGPMVRATPRLADKIDVETTRKAGNRWSFRRFPGGFIKFVGSNSPSSVKSTPAPIVIVEEPDDCSTNLKGQGDSIKLLEERTKTYHNRKIIYGGTPTNKGFSAIEDAFLGSDQRYFMVPCHDCNLVHALTWDNVKWDVNKNHRHEIYGNAIPETAYYACPHCGSMWDDYQKNSNVRSGHWLAHREERGVAGFHINELYSSFPGCRLRVLVEKFLSAQYKVAQGEMDDLIAFVNSTLGLPYEFGDQKIDIDEFALVKGEDYPEGVVPMGGLVLAAGIDVQHDRVAVILRAYGRDEESWLVYWGELYGDTTDLRSVIWKELEAMLFAAWCHEGGRRLYLKALSIDSGDGATADNVYTWVRDMQRVHPGTLVMAVKGSSDDGSVREIFSAPRVSIDHRHPTKSDKYGLRVFIIGTSRAKDLLLGTADASGRVRLDGTGPGRFHVYRDVRADYWRQLFSEVKAPSRRLRGRMTWVKKSGVRNEALDAECYALHAARALKLNIKQPVYWDDLVRRLMQGDLFAHQETDTLSPMAKGKQSAPNPPIPRVGLGSKEWNL